MWDWRIDVLIEQIRIKQTPCIVGIDPDPALMSADFTGVHDASAEMPAVQVEIIEKFGAEIIDAVHDIVPAIKPQIAYYADRKN